MTKSLYFDYNATTPLDCEVKLEMHRFLEHAVGNPSSLHGFGQEIRITVARARGQVARLIGARPDEIIFTSGGTESNNTALAGVARMCDVNSGGIAVSTIEHQSILNPVRHLARTGYSVRFLPVTQDGTLDLDRLNEISRSSTRLVSVMLANNDTGVLQPVKEAACIAHESGALFHTDAVQAVGKVAVDVASLGVDLLSISAHKLHGPTGIGALYVKRGTPLAPLLYGGMQERGMRPGTENALAIVGFGKACEQAALRMEEDIRRTTDLRVYFETRLRERLPNIVVNAETARRLPNTSNIRFPGIKADALVMNLDVLGLAVSGGSACSAGEHKPSHVLLAMGLPPEQAETAVRFSIGRETSGGDIERAVDLIAAAVRQMMEPRHAHA